MSGEQDGKQAASEQVSLVDSKEIDWDAQHDIVEELYHLIKEMKQYSHRTAHAEWLNSKTQEFRYRYCRRYKKLINEVQHWTSLWQMNANYCVDETTLERELEETRPHPWNSGHRQSDED
jgi:hypothetical protein